MNSLTERRSAERIRSRIEFTYQKIEEGGTLFPVQKRQTLDISKDGLLFECSELLIIDAHLRLSLYLPNLDRPVIVEAKVVRIEEIEFHRRYRVGVSFVQIKEEDRVEIITRVERFDILRLLQKAVELKASDLHLTHTMPPIVRVHGELKPLEDWALTREDLKLLIYSILNDRQIMHFEEGKELDFAFSPSPERRFRVNIHQQRGNVEAAFRLIAFSVPSIVELRLPSTVETLARCRKGMVLITGPTNSGKTTTLAAMVNLINQEREAVVICLESPIEYLHMNRKAIIKQREVGVDTLSFSAALKHALRQDPDVIMVGEMEDLETTSTAIIAAETGHLVLTSLHATDTIQALDRMVSAFPASQQKQICAQLSRCLQGIVNQLLLPLKDGKGLIVATEILVMTDAARRLIRDNNLVHLNSTIQTGAQHGMHTMQESIRRLLEAGYISRETALEYCRELEGQIK